jgi:outer membrane murein-binding lipoprotein Lpp
MNNDEKILELLNSMQGQMGELSGKMGNLSDRIDTLSDDLNEKIDNLSERVDTLSARVDTLSDDLNGKIDNLSERVDTLSHHVTNIELHLENTTDRNIGLLMEQYKPNVDKLDRVAEQVEGIQFDLDGLKRVVIAHSKDINDLMKR